MRYPLHLWSIGAELTIKESNTVYCHRQIPTFILNGRVQGFETAEQAEVIAKQILNPLNDPNITVAVTAVAWVLAPEV